MINRYSTLVCFIISLMMACTLPACSFSASTANINDAQMARDPEGNDPTTVFSPEDTFYSIVELSNAPDDTVVTVVWTALDVEGVDPNTTIDEASTTSGSDQLVFDLANEAPWPVGEYEVELSLNDEQEPASTLEFEVQQ